VRCLNPRTIGRRSITRQSGGAILRSSLKYSARSRQKAIGLCIQRNEQGPVDLYLRSEDVQYFISLILALSHEARRLQSTPELDVPPSAAIPLPITAIDVGRTSDDQSFLMVEVGVVSLTFGLRLVSLEQVGQALSALSARTSPRSLRAAATPRRSGLADHGCDGHGLFAVDVRKQPLQIIDLGQVVEYDIEGLFG
jgi:hypothetical protein